MIALTHSKCEGTTFFVLSRRTRKAESPVALGFGELQTFEYELQHYRGDGLAFCEGVKMKPPPFQAFEIKAKPGGIPKKNLDLIARLIEKAEQMPGQGVHGKPMFDQGGKTIDALAHVSGFQA